MRDLVWRDPDRWGVSRRERLSPEMYEIASQFRQAEMKLQGDKAFAQERMIYTADLDRLRRDLAGSGPLLNQLLGQIEVDFVTRSSIHQQNMFRMGL